MQTFSPAESRQARIDLAAAFRWAVRHGLNEGICNHFSLAVGDDRFLVNAHGLHWSEITASSILLADGEGDIIEGDRPVEPTAFFIHSRVHRACPHAARSEEHTSELQSLMRTSYAVFCLKKKKI